MKKTRKIYQLKLITHKTISDAEKAVAKIVCAQVTKNKKSILSLATGGTFVNVYKYIVQSANKHKIDFQNIKTFNLDEYANLDKRFISESYHSYMHNNLFKHLNINAKNTHFPPAINPTSYDKAIDKAGGIDLQLLGIGHNGHIAFNEPGSLLTSKTRKINLTKDTIKANSRFFDNNTSNVPKQAVTMGLATILKAKKHILLATGQAKAAAIKKLLLNKYDPRYPCTALVYCPNVEIHIDESIRVS